MLVNSYLDGHEDVVLLPDGRSELIYEFFQRYPSFSLHDKLIAYPFYLPDSFQGDSSILFQGHFPISAADYYAAVAAVFEIYGHCSTPLLETRRAFFQFLLVAYSLALGRRPATPRPLMLFDQHWWGEERARRFVKDFPQARFLHTVRDPISSYDRMFEHSFREERWAIEASWRLIRTFTKSDVPHPGMESRTRAIRFEDLHTNTAEVIGRLADWLGLSHQASLLQSTFNGTPWVVGRAGVNWSGPRPEQALRSSQNISFTDKIMLFAMFYENFVAWNYSISKIYRHASVRGLACILVLLIPMKTEAISACAVVKTQLLPSLRRGDFRLAFKSVVGICKCRLAMIYSIISEICRRLVFGKTVLEIL
jgi:hypothetical protein